MKLKKSLLSLATVIALSNTVSADSTATYLPLTSKTSDSSWILFGVNGYSNGVPSSATTSSAFTSGYTSFEDALPDDEAADTANALQDSGSNGTIATLQGVKGTGLTSLLAAIDISTAPAPVYDVTEPVRTMYFKTSNIYVKLDYKASLEGKAIELYINNTMYNSTISQTATYDNPATLADGNVGSSGGNTDDMKLVSEVLDFDFTDNPYDPASFDKTTQLTTTGQTATFYHFNAKTQQWEIWNKNSDSAANDFTQFDLGKAYWGRIDKTDTLGALTNDTSTNRAGLILGDDSAASVPDENRYVDGNDTRLVEGWNMLSFDNVQPYIRHSATGLILTMANEADEQFKITDASGINSITLPVFANSGTEADAILANKAIESAKLRGLLPQTFNVKFFRGNANRTIVIISDEKFSITQVAGTTNLGAASIKTLTGANPYIAGTQTAVSTLKTQTATSAYGEYMVLAQVNVEEFDGTASNVADTIGASTGGVAALSYQEEGQTAETVKISTAGTTTYAQFVTQMGTLSNPATNPTITEIDADFSGTAAGDLVIIANTTPFSLEDKTYTRVFDYTVPGGATSLNAVLGSGTTNIAIANGDSLATAAGKIDAKANIYADNNSITTKLVVVNTDSSSFDLKDAESGTLDLLDSSSINNIIAEGAVSDVYRVDTIASKAVDQVTSVVATITTSTANNDAFSDTDTTDTIDYTINGGVKQNVAIAGGGGDGANTYGELVTMLDDLVTSMNAYINTNNLHAYASHDYTIPAGKLATDTLAIVGGAATAHTVNITLKGVDVASLLIGFTDNGATAANVGTAAAESVTGNAGQITFGDGDLRADLKTNPVYAPNYATYGPLYTMRKAGFDIKAMLQATTELDATTGEIAWDSIDITRNEQDWFKNNEYNLFNINNASGYWVYLTPKTADTVTISNPSVTTPAYTYYFSNDSTSTPKYPTTNILTSGQLTVTIDGLDSAAASSVYATIKGEKIQLSGSANQYTGDLSTHALKELVQDQTGPIDITIRAVNGKGQAVEASTTFDYRAPDNLAVTVANGVNLNFTADNNATKFYIFKDYIPELKATRDALTTTVEVNATSSAATYNVCKEYDFGSVSTLRVIAADGTINAANLSAAVEIKYASLLKSANVLSHTQGSTSKTQLGTKYDSSCVSTGTQTLASENAGVSLKTLTTGATYRISFQPITGANFTTDVAWTSHYELTAGSGGVIEIQNTPQYAGKTFYVENVATNTIYVGTFPADKNTADTSISGASGASIDLTAFTGANTTLLP